MVFTLWISPVLSAMHPSSSGRTMITHGPPPTSCLPGKPIGRGDAPQLPPVNHTPGQCSVQESDSAALPLRRPMFMVWSLILPFRALICTTSHDATPSSLPVLLSHCLPPETDTCHGDTDGPVQEPHPVSLRLLLCFMLSHS